MPAPIRAGDLTSRLAVQDIDGASLFSTCGKRVAVGLEELAEGESVQRTRWEVTVRRRETYRSLLPFRLVYGSHVMFATGLISDDTARDQTVLHCVDALNLSSGGSDDSTAETVTLYRGTDSINADRSTSRTWSSVTTGILIRLEEADATIARRIFGAEIDHELRGTVELSSGIQLDDGLRVTDGAHTGINYLVTARKIDPRLPAQAYLSLLLTRTPESFS